MPLPKSFTNVTKFSKALAMFLFVLLPIIGYYLGLQSGKTTNPEISKSAPRPKNTVETATPFASESADFKPYISEPLDITFEHPADWVIKPNNATTADTASIQLYSPMSEEILPYLPTALKEKFIITISKWPEQETDAFVLFSKVDQTKFGADQSVYSNNNRTLRQANENAYLLKGDGDVIFVKQGIYAGLDEKSFTDFLSTFVFNDHEQARWKTYTNKEIGFSIKHPEPTREASSEPCLAPDANQEVKTTMFCVTTELLAFQLDTANLKPNQTLQQFISSTFNDDMSRYTSTAITVAGKTGISTVGDINYGGNDAIYLPLKDNQILIIKWTGNQTRLNQVLNTLTFTK